MIQISVNEFKKKAAFLLLRKSHKATTKAKRIQRSNSCIALGFDNYNEYLRSDLWKDIRRVVLSSKGALCNVCKKTIAVEIHHKQYDYNTMAGHNIKHLIPVCQKCHSKLEHWRKKCNRLSLQ